MTIIRENLFVVQITSRNIYTCSQLFSRTILKTLTLMSPGPVTVFNITQESGAYLYPRKASRTHSSRVYNKKATLYVTAVTKTCTRPTS